MNSGRYPRRPGQPRPVPFPPNAAGKRGRQVTGRLIDQPLVPPPPDQLPTVELRTPLQHPLVYRKRIKRVSGGPRAGDCVHVVSGDGETLGFGLYNPKSEVSLRMLTWESTPLSEAWWDEKLADAVQLRSDVLQLNEVTNAYRVIHAEGDGLPGLVVDRIGDVLSAEVFSIGMMQRIEPILEKLHSLCGTSTHLVQPAPHVLAQEGFEVPTRASEGLPSTVEIHEFGTRFRVRFADSHKTGFFCDQRDNRRLLASFCKDKSVLDLCCYTGGFSVQAKVLGQATEVVGVDLDQSPIEVAKENANLNQARVRFVQADVFPYMRDMIRNGQQFDVVVLDPPKLIRSRAELEEGTRKHFDLNRLAMQLVRRGGILMTCTCAGLLQEVDFVRLVHAAARQAGEPLEDVGPGEWSRRGPRNMQVLFKTGASPDHPVASNCPEGEYLNTIVARMM